LELHTLGRTFDTVIDSGLFHVLSDEELPLFVDNLAAVVRRGGTYFMLSFSELTPKLDFSKVKDYHRLLKDFLRDFSKLKGLMPYFVKLKAGDWPRHVTQAEIKELFRDGWHINYIRQATQEGRMEPSEVHAWLSSISRE
jgi:cyclopropane fatty-acyl-phospholipid synthase-like methyltransferase